VAHRFDVVAVEVAHEAAVVTGVVLGPDPRLVQHVDALAAGGLDEGVDLLPGLRPEADVDVLVRGTGVPTGPIQKLGKVVPVPWTSPKLMIIVPPSDARTRS
jgi:hypothetical protein